MSVIDTILEKFDLKYEDLKGAERDTLNSWIEALETNKLTIESVKSFVGSLRDSVEDELVKTDNNSRQDLYLKARLRNLKLLDSFLTSPEKAKAAIERTIAGIAGRKVE